MSTTFIFFFASASAYLTERVSEERCVSDFGECARLDRLVRLMTRLTEDGKRTWRKVRSLPAFGVYCTRAEIGAKSGLQQDWNGDEGR
jgi:hypothetical protein